MTISACLMSSMDTCGSNCTEYGLVTALPSSEATVTRKRGSPFNRFQSLPALWNTSIGPMALEG
jgi:hypothetical protein